MNAQEDNISDQDSININTSSEEEKKEAVQGNFFTDSIDGLVEKPDAQKSSSISGEADQDDDEEEKDDA